MGSSHYRLPYRIINPVWARLSKPAAAVLLVLGSFMNKDTKQCFPSRETIGRLAGIDTDTVIVGINGLLAEGLIKRWRAQGRGKWKHNVYKLKGKAVCEEEKSYLIFNKKMRNKWRELTLSEMKVYVVLAMRASIDEANEEDNYYGFRAFGKMTQGRMAELAGVCRKTVYNALEGLEEKGWVERFENEWMEGIPYALWKR